MAGEVAQPPVSIGPTDSLYRGIHPSCYDQGILMSTVFPLSKKHTLEDGPSVGFAALIPLAEFRSRMGDGWGVGEFPAAIPQSHKLIVHPLPAPEWGEYTNAHGVLTNYQHLTNNQLTSIARALRDALKRNILVLPTESSAST